MANNEPWEKYAPVPPNRLIHLAILLCLLVLCPAPTQAQGDPPPPRRAQEEQQVQFTGGPLHFIDIVETVADLRNFDPRDSASDLRSSGGGSALTGQAAIDAAQELFGPRGFDAVQAMSKAGQLDAGISNSAAEGRRLMMSGAMSQTLSELRGAHGNDLIIGAMDSGNKASGSASDIDATMFAMMKDGSRSPVSTANVIERFNANFEALYQHPPAHFGIEAMNGEEMYPDWRATHMTLEEFRAEARQVVQAKRENPEAYRSEGELRIHAEGRGNEALKNHFQELRTLETRLADAIQRSPTNPEADPLVRRMRAQIDEHQKLSPWTQFETRVDADGRPITVEVKDSDPRERIMPNEPELVRRYAFDGAYDNWIMWVAHPANRPKYLLRSVSDGVGLLTSLRPGTGRYDMDRPWKAQVFEYEKVYGDMYEAEGQRAQNAAEQTRLQFIRDIYGGMDANETGLNTERIRKTLDTAAKARLRHKGHPRFANATEAQIYSEYMPDPARVPDPAQALPMAKAAWESDAHSLMLENLQRTVRAPGDIVRGWGDAAEWEAIRQNLTPEQRAVVSPTRLRAAAWLQLYHGFLDLMTDDHARQILEAKAQGRSSLEITGRAQAQGRIPDMVDRLVSELSRGQAPDDAEARIELERVLVDVAATRQLLNPSLGEPRLATAVVDVLRQELDTRIRGATSSIADWKDSFERVRQDFDAGRYPPAVVADRVMQGAATRLARASAQTLGEMGFRGEITVRQTIDHLGNIEQRGVPEFEVRFADQGWDAKQALTGMATVGNLDSFVQILYAYQKGGAEAAGRQLVWELWMNVRYVSQAHSVYQSLQMWDYQPIFMAAVGSYWPLVGQAYMVVNIATTSVRIVGDMVLDPLKEDDIAMAYQGFLGSENAFIQDQRGQRFNVLSPVPIRVVPKEFLDEDGDKKTNFFFREYSKEEAIRVLIERSTELDFGPIPLDTIYAVGLEDGVWGGGAEWEAAYAQAQKWLNSPRLNFESKRASLYPFYRDRLDAWIRDESGANADDLEVLLATHMRDEYTPLLTSFFEPITRDWAHGRGDFEGMGGGANELMIPWTAQDSIRFFGGIAGRMASDLVRSYRMVGMNIVVQQDTASNTDVLLDTSHEAQMIRRAYASVDKRLRQAATRLAAMMDDARKGVEVSPALGQAVHDIRLDRNRFEDAKPHVHVRPRILSADDPTAANRSDQVEFSVSVVADTAKYPTPYRHETEWTVVETDSVTADLSAVVRVYDATGTQVGDSVPVELGTVLMEVDDEREPFPLRSVVEPRVGDPDEGLASPQDPQPNEEVSPEAIEVPKLLIYDDVAVYFQPARDTTEAVWDWRIVRVDAQGDSAVVRAGVFVSNDTALNTTEWAPRGAPATFVTELPNLWDEDGHGQGTYVVQSCEPAAVSGLFGTTSGYAGCHFPWTDSTLGMEDVEFPWRDEGSFEVGAVTLKLKDLIAEQGVATADSELGPWLSVENATRQEGGGADIVHTWAECVNAEAPGVSLPLPCAQHGEVNDEDWQTVRHEERTRVDIQLPNELDLQALLMGDMEVRLFPSTELTASPWVTAHDLVPGKAADRALLNFSSTAGVHPPSEDDLETIPLNRAVVGADAQSHPYHFHNGFRREVGELARTMGDWVRDFRTNWFLPVRLAVEGNDVFVYAVYGVSPGPYTGPIPTLPGSMPPVQDSPPVGDDPGADDPVSDDPVVDDPVGDDPAADDPAGDDPAGDDPVGDDPVGDDPVGDEEPGGPVDPNTLNPNDPDISGLIRQWIGAARPPKSVEPDNHYVYEEWGRFVGSGADGNITANSPPDARGAMSSVEYVWTLRDNLDSVDHCTLGEYVVRSLEGTGTSECLGRYRPSPRAPDFIGRPVAEVTEELRSEGYTVNVSIADWPENPDQANTVLRQIPGAGRRLPPGTPVDLTIYGPYQEPEPAERTVLNVYGLRFEDARGMLADSGFVAAEPRGGDPAPTEDMAFRVAAQSVAGGETRAEGTEIRLTLFGPYNPTAGERQADPPPPPTQPVERGPSCNDLVMAGNRAQNRGDLTGAFELFTTALNNGCTNPGLSDARDGVYQSPRCTQLIQTGRTQYDLGNFTAAIQALRSAEREGCDMSRLGPLIDGTLTGLETGTAEALGQNCSGIANEIADARRRGDEATARALSTTALVQGCSGAEIATAASTPIGNRPTGGGVSAGTGGVTSGTGDVTLTEPRSGLVTQERVIPVAGRVTVPGAERVALIVNGEERQVSVANGEFSTMVPLITGQNTIQAVANSSAFSDRVTVQADVAPADVWIQLTWDGPADIDLHLYMPNGGHVYFSNKEASGALLDVDNTLQDGPEHITMTQAIPGEYRVEVHYYTEQARPGGGTQVPWQVLVRLDSGQNTQRFSGTLTQQGERTDVYTFVFR